MPQQRMEMSKKGEIDNTVEYLKHVEQNAWETFLKTKAARLFAELQVINVKNLSAHRIVLQWLKDFIYVINFTCVFSTLSCNKVIAKLRELGYKSGDMVGLPKEAYCNFDTAARYLIGMTINYMEDDQPPHPCLEEMIEELFLYGKPKHFSKYAKE